MSSGSTAATESAEHDDGHHGPSFLAHHFDTPVQQFDAAKLGMWLFLAQEVLFFSGLFVFYGIYRLEYPEAFSVGSHLLNKEMGGLNTIVLLLSSFTVAMAVRSSQVGKRKHTSVYLLLTILFAGVFMVIKYFEYSHKIHVGTLPGEHFAPTAQGKEELEAAMAASGIPGIETVPYHIRSFFGAYFMLTGVHGLHVLIGMGVLTWVLIKNMKGQFGPEYFTPIDISALYWHLVDLIWIYLFPLLYLIE
jgi:cytochrome c oxidase subunit 3